MRRASRRQVLSGAGALLAGGAIALGLSSLGSSHRVSPADGKEVALAPLASGTLEQRFDLLSRLHTNTCGLAAGSLSAIAEHGRLQGSCCSAMVYSEYVRQIRGLKSYVAVPEIPSDPYDIAVGLAARLVGYDRAITLTPSQQSVYDRAVKLSHEHGPCCCRCWRWSAFGGQAKELISRRRYDAKQIAQIWDLEDGCGGGSAGPMMMS